MTIFIGADHRGFDLKNKLIEYLQEQNIRVEDMGNYEYDPKDDYTDFGKKVAEAVSSAIPTSDQLSRDPGDLREALGIVICGSGVGVSIAANRTQGIRCGLGFDVEQVRHARQNDHINILSLPSDYMKYDKAKQMVDIFLSTKPNMEEIYIRRTKKLDI